MTSRLIRATKFGIFVGILFSAALLYLPKVVSEQCGPAGIKTYTVLGSGPHESPLPNDRCGTPLAQDQVVNELDKQSKVIAKEVDLIVNTDEVEKNFPVKDYMGKFINMEYLNSKPLLAKNFMTFATIGAGFFFIFAPIKPRKIFRL